MKQVKRSFRSSYLVRQSSSKCYKRECPQCGKFELNGLSGSWEAVCRNCGYKEPCCFD